MFFIKLWGLVNLGETTYINQVLRIFFTETSDCNSRDFWSPVSLHTYPSFVRRFWLFLVEVEWTSPG